jgi:hypothetical protein
MDKYKLSPFYEVMEFAAKRNGISEVNVINGFMRYGSDSSIS